MPYAIGGLLGSLDDSSYLCKIVYTTVGPSFYQSVRQSSANNNENQQIKPRISCNFVIIQSFHQHEDASLALRALLMKAKIYHCLLKGDCDPYALCTNTEGSRLCECNSGFLGDGETCTDIDECAVENGYCSLYATCTNTMGSRECECNSGFSGTGEGTYGCEDVNECETDNGGCHSLAACTNNVGTRQCKCPIGYCGNGVGIGSGCKDIDECAITNGGCNR